MSGTGSGTGGSQFATGASGAIGSSGSATRVFSVHFISGANAGVLALYNGTAIVGVSNLYCAIQGTANTGKTANFGDEGLFFPDGLFWANQSGDITSVLFSYSQ